MTPSMGAIRILFLSTLSLRRATAVQHTQINKLNDFYPRSPCGERPCTMTTIICTVLFLSTLSLRRATLALVSMICLPLDFYPRSPCGERPSKIGVNLIDRVHFYPRSPCGERRVHYDNYNLHCVISIHALLAESDRC